MAARLSGTGSLRLTLRYGRRLPVQHGARQLSSTALRSKDVASQEHIPNLRHARRPRMNFQSLFILEIY